MSEQDIYNKFVEEYCRNCTKECTEKSHGITITYDYRTKLRSAKCSEYKRKEESNASNR